MRNLKIFLKCLFRSLRRTSALPLAQAHSIGILQLAQLGDMVCTTPLFRGIKKARPEVRLTVFGKAAYQDLLAHNADIDRYLSIKPEDRENLIVQIRDACLDAAILPTPTFAGLSSLYLAGVPHIIVPIVKGGFSPLQTFFYRLLSYFVIRVSYDFSSYIPGEMLRLLQPLNISATDITKHLGYGEQAKHWVENILKPYQHNFLVGLSVSSGNKIKNWSGKKFAEFINAISLKKDIQFVLIGGPDDEVEVKEFKTFLTPDIQLIDMSGQLDLEHLKALIAHLNMFVSVDTGPIYIAEAFGVPTIDIVGPVAENEQPPRGPKHRIVKANRKAPAIHILNSRLYDQQEAIRQIQDITVDQVVQEFNSLLHFIQTTL
jgi:ADP-heptose:LPS heptosyltransferase